MLCQCKTGKNRQCKNMASTSIGDNNLYCKRHHQQCINPIEHVQLNNSKDELIEQLRNQLRENNIQSEQRIQECNVRILRIEEEVDLMISLNY